MSNIKAIMASFNEQLAELHIFVEQMQATSSSLEKVEILKKQSGFIQGVLNYTYDAYKQYNLTGKTLIKLTLLADPDTYHEITILDREIIDGPIDWSN